MISLWGEAASPREVNASRVTAATGKEEAIQVVTDLLWWSAAHGYDADDVLDAAQARFEAGL
ncbi:hypothetical protein ACFWIN_14595 [Streptomyces sp. NPDC127049]|uniref:hypothetical protein n=1 Tax=Streptomyces sp. NPDC127049 TaxID=3347118 RepID=UPI0036596445